MLFSEEYLHFFMDLSANNNRDWFHENKKRYEEFVRKPFIEFSAEMIQGLNSYGMDLGELEPKQCLFRINRDIRFSKDKSPYKLQYSAAFSKGGKKDMQNPGMYIEFSPEHFRIYSGVYMPDKEQLYSIRKKIANSPTEFSRLIQDSQFKKEFGEIRGEKNKRLPKEFQAAAEQQDLLFNKQFYFFSEEDPLWPLQENLVPQIIEKFDASKGVREFLMP